MTDALQTLHSELALLRSMHAAAVACGLTEIAFDITSDIADLVAATEVLERSGVVGAMQHRRAAA